MRTSFHKQRHLTLYCPKFVRLFTHNPLITPLIFTGSLVRVWPGEEPISWRFCRIWWWEVPVSREVVCPHGNAPLCCHDDWHVWSGAHRSHSCTREQLVVKFHQLWSLRFSVFFIESTSLSWYTATNIFISGEIQENLNQDSISPIVGMIFFPYGGINVL